MIDHLVGRPNPSWKRAQVFLVIIFWLWRIIRGGSGPPRLLWLKTANRFLQRFTPWQIIVSTLTAVYAIRNFDKILGLESPEPLRSLYSPNYYRATWITTGLDAGFATAMSIRPKWLRDVCALVFSAYYIAYPNEADEKLRRFRAVPTVEMLRYTWEKTSNPIFLTHLKLRIFTSGPSIAMRKKILLPRPASSTYRRPITCYIYYAHTPEKLKQCTDLILDFPGGGFVAMSPEHHEDRLKMWAHGTGKVVLAVDYDPYPFAIDEAFDTYQVLVKSGGSAIGMCGKKLNVVITSDSAGATLAVNVVLRILEHNNMAHVSRESSLPIPLALVLNYAALDFNFTSWMTEDNLRVLRAEQSSGNLPGLRELAEQKDHLKHISPLSMVGDRGSGESRKHRKVKRKNSWKDTLRGLTTSGSEKEDSSPICSRRPSLRRSISGLKIPPVRRTFLREPEENQSGVDSSNDEDDDYTQRKEEDRPLQARVKYIYPYITPATAWIGNVAEKQEELSAALLEADSKAAQTMVNSHPDEKKKESIGVRLTMTSRTGYFQDRIISPSMMRAMAILYIGPHRNPDFTTDYHLSPILAPNRLLAQFPPLLMQCGEKDPFVDDTVIFAGRVREAKRARKIELDLAISGKSARFGETLRMSTVDAGHVENVAALKRERDKLARQNEDDWVQLVLFAEWSHGYLQMAALIPEAKVVIEDLGGWIEDAFLRYSGKVDGEDKAPTAELWVAKPASPRRVSKSINKRLPSPFTSETENDDSGITFVVKKDGRTSNDMGMIDIENERTDSTKIDPTSAVETNTKTDAEEEKTFEPDDENKSGNVESAGTKTSISRQGGQVISESELMRRRRLLDSHIFE
ncbi:Alpha/Beta hydrolase protein [Lentinula aciculospora]|uniref:Alpha/Beta hydrolase protein n=1 Tax=Lentinula aciculospora TaxID=153920 RepID=A0A9W9DRR3_9AGAR|nr:Alpha/Beta hydrolase protein [Lentinula aciculospora]